MWKVTTVQTALSAENKQGWKLISMLYVKIMSSCRFFWLECRSNQPHNLAIQLFLLHFQFTACFEWIMNVCGMLQNVFNKFVLVHWYILLSLINIVSSSSSYPYVRQVDRYDFSSEFFFIPCGQMNTFKIFSVWDKSCKMCLILITAFSFTY